MPDYLTADRLPSLIQGLEIGADGALTDEDAEFIIDLIEGEVNAILTSLGVETPVSSSDSPYSFRFIRALVVQGVMGLVQASIHALSDDTEGSREGAFFRRYERGIKALTDFGGAYLRDAVSLTGDLIRNVPAAAGVQSNDPRQFLGLQGLTAFTAYENEIRLRRLRPFSGRTFDGPLGIA